VRTWPAENSVRTWPAEQSGHSVQVRTWVPVSIAAHIAHIAPIAAVPAAAGLEVFDLVNTTFGGPTGKDHSMWILAQAEP
jgi:hypothetical protein